MHDTLTVGIPLLVIMFGIFLNKNDLNRVETVLKADFGRIESGLKSDLNRLETKVDRMQSDLSMFYKILGEHGADIENIKKKLAS